MIIRPSAAVRFAGEDYSLGLKTLSEQSASLASGLRAAGVRPGDRVGLLMGNEPDFLRGLFALSRLGAAACPLPLPAGGRDAYVGRVQGILRTAGVRDVLVSARLARLGALTGRALEGARALGTAELEGHAGTVDGPAVPASAEAVVQFTSGSTARPKGVRLTQANVLAGLRAISAGIALRPDSDRAAVWLPLFHDMGLFGLLSAVLTGADATVWTPSAFVKRPERWLREMTADGCTACAMPNFAYDYLCDGVAAEDVPGLDLGRWRVAFNGAEPVADAALRRFARHFAPAGFRPTAMMPVYGMAEATLAVTFPPLGREPRTDWADRRALAGDGLARPVPAGTAHARPLVSVGSAVAGLEIRITGESGVLPERRIGEIEVRGASVTDGYVGDVAQPFTADGWLRTGDLGYLADGELYVTGRRKEMMTLRGENHYPEDVERAVREHRLVHRRRCAAYSQPGEDGGSIVLVVESTAREGAERDAFVAELRGMVRSDAGLDEVDVRVVPPDTIPRTSSGKLRRLALASLPG
ncbi:AMP-binding protein [Streptomyces sp. NPDC004959]|uniref:AMP-binding protein n=1 Tax=unclassified Streptomyces TaxID=2593676 RepID=UPI00131E1384|nr:AMP-binding protein [Streptomyces sp. NRRL F-5630]